MKWTRKEAQIRTRNYSIKQLEAWGGCDIIEARWYDKQQAHFVMDVRGDVYLYKPKTTPAIAFPLDRIEGNRGANDALPRVRARVGEMVFMFRSDLRPLGKPNATNTETARDKSLETRVGQAIAKQYKLTYEPSSKNDGVFFRKAV
jgi:hypothetical protein